MPYEVNAIAFAGYHKVVAAALSVSPTLVDKFTHLPKSHGGDGENSPTQRFIEQVRALRAAGAPNADVLLEYACAELGCLPPIRAELVEDPDDRDRTLIDVADATAKFAEYLRCAAEVQRDGILTITEMKALSERIWAELRALHAQHAMLQRSIGDGEIREVRQRIGPKRALPKYLQLRRATA